MMVTLPGVKILDLCLVFHNSLPTYLQHKDMLGQQRL